MPCRTLPAYALSRRSVRALTEANVIPFTIGVNGQIFLYVHFYLLFIIPEHSRLREHLIFVNRFRVKKIKKQKKKFVVTHPHHLLL